jgi:hypothetical protein
MNGRGVHPQAHIVEEDSTSDKAKVDQELVPISKRFQSRNRIITIQTQIQCEMVASTDRNAEEGHITVSGHRRNQTQRPVSTSHPNRVSTGADSIVSELREIVTPLQHHDFDPKGAGLLFEPDRRRLPVAAPTIDDQRRIPNPRATSHIRLDMQHEGTNLPPPKPNREDRTGSEGKNDNAPKPATRAR